jgi:putative addiction module component (TIGR02574 family)
MTVSTLLEEARKLTREQQADLLDELLLMVGPDAADALTPAQREDLDRRMEEYESGNSRMVPGDQAFDHLRKRR